jgi:hypothetical protein
MVMQQGSKLDQDAAIDLLLSRAAIQDLTLKYCRAVDRCDMALLKSVYWPDAYHDQGMFAGNIDDFAEFSVNTVKQMDRAMHAVTNCLIEFDDPDHAHAETYVVAWHDIPSELGPTHIAAGARYLDQFERRSAEWRMLKRVFVADWHQMHHSTMNMNNPMSSKIKNRGGHFPNDPAFGFFTFDPPTAD